MNFYDNEMERGFVLGSVKTYGAAINKITEMWRAAFGEEMQLGSGSPKALYQEALRQLFAKIEEIGTEALLQKLTAEQKEILVDNEVLGADGNKLPPQGLWRDMDDVTPKLLKRLILSAMRDLAAKFDEQIVDLNLADVLRHAMRGLAAEMGWPSAAHVGNNRHFPRLWQYVLELVDDYYWDDTYGIRVMNVSGPVPGYPSGPGRLRVRVNKDMICW